MKLQKATGSVMLLLLVFAAIALLKLPVQAANESLNPVVTAIAYAHDKRDATASVPIPDRADEAAYIIGQSKVFWKANNDDISPEAKNLFYVEFSKAMENRYYLFDVQFGDGPHYGLLSGNGNPG